ncbi:MAG: hypothetical protein LC793_02930 [Thermomicrobia bacterium]|nr:hypothetical protein [Thermomicrobia bacterium]MCA1724545.1 hypothetical protein [Thermomicrobia bacterium]
MYYLDDRGTVIRLYYLVRGDPPLADEFLSRAARGLPVSSDPVAERWAAGVSMNATPDQVRATAARFVRTRWRFIATLELPTNGQQIQIQRTSGSLGHFTIWGDPEILQRYVITISPI